MERSTIHYLKQKGWTNVQIAELLGHHRDTIARVLREPVDQQPAKRQSAVAVFSDQIRAGLDLESSLNPPFFVV
jgi:IS30 family transposase